MASRFNPPTRIFCEVCEELEKRNEQPLIDNHSGKASSANNFPIHNWFNFVLGYSPEFPEYIIKKEGINSDHIILDPFAGTGTTNVVCKFLGIESFGIEANDYFINVCEHKLNWNCNPKILSKDFAAIIQIYNDTISKINFDNGSRENLFFQNVYDSHYTDYLNSRPIELTDRYLSDKPFVRLIVLKNVIKNYEFEKQSFEKLFLFALSSIIISCSNVSYGPGFSIKKAKEDINVYDLFYKKMSKIIDDLSLEATVKSKKIKSKVFHGDARSISNHISINTVDFMITSPPYPGDHEYTKHTRLELIFEDIARTKEEFRIIKKRMLVGSTTNIYKESNDRVNVENNRSIKKITDLIQKRLIEDNSTSGFEKLYTKLVWEYFGGMAIVFAEALKVLKNQGKFALLVSDSHAFKMVHIQTAVLLKEIALDCGFTDGEIILWQNKKTTSHKYNLREEILILTK